jgi:hypothetical protein
MLTEWSKQMRSVLAFGLLITLCASAFAATVRRSKPPQRHLRRQLSVQCGSPRGREVLSAEPGPTSTLAWR